MPAPLATHAPESSLLARTPSLPLGPFYPGPRHAPAGTSIWASAEGAAPARRLVLQGRVLNGEGQPLRDVVVEVWHADPEGRYRHPNQPGVERIDRAFAGYGAQTTDGRGAWRFVSVMPGCYGVGSRLRAPHLHFQVTHRASRLVTQMFFPSHAGNESDRWYRAVSRPEGLLGRVTENDAHGLTVTWDIVVDSPPIFQSAGRRPIEETT